MFINPEFQKQGLGTTLLKFIEPIMNEKNSYCIPFSHLKRFYKQIDFIDINKKGVPNFLLRRYENYQKNGHNVKLMQRVKQ